MSSTAPYPALNALSGPRLPLGVAIFGAGASGRELAWLAQQIWGEDLPLRFIVDEDYFAAREVNQFDVTTLAAFARASPEIPVAIGVGDPMARQRCVERCSAAGLRFQTLVHPRAETSRFISLGAGVVVCAGCILTTNVEIGNHVHINIGCTISHDAQIGDFATLSPGVRLAGWVTLGQRVFMGIGSNVLNGTPERRIYIGDDAVVGAGACVTQDVRANSTVVGVPARPL